MAHSPVPHPSLSRHLPSDALPRLLHSLHEERNSVLSISSDENYIFSGSQCHDISVWDKQTFNLKTILRGHTGSILSLEYAEDRRWLFSSSGDSTVRIWSTETLTPIYILNPYLETGAGDLFSIVWSPPLQTIFIGCQNTSLQWYDFQQSPEDASASGSSPGSSTSSRVAHKFFDSYPQYQRRPADIHASNGLMSPTLSKLASDDYVPAAPRAILRIPPTNVIDSAHYGYIYCMALLPSTRVGSDDPPPPRDDGSTHLVTGSGDETVKLWNCTPAGPKEVHTFDCCHGAVLALVVRGDTAYAGCQDGYVKVWDLETKTIVRTIMVQENVDLLSLSMLHTDLFTCSANGQVQRWSASFDCTASWSAHDGIVLSSIISRQQSHSDSYHLITGGNDNYIKIWDLTSSSHNTEESELGVCSDPSAYKPTTDDTMAYALSKFVSIRSISSCPSHQEDCRQAAIWLKKCLSQLGATSNLLSTGDGTNPLVMATFEGTQGKHPKPRVLFYGHYDVISAPSASWLSDPFTLTGRNGYLYGRGVTDNKGPIMAAACAAADLLGKRALGLDLVFLIEGEEECGSTGFGEAVRKHKSLIGHIDAILVSNSTWIAEDPPCITYGLRGVVHCKVEVSSNRPDLHSGVDGGAIAEPMFDMVRVLSTLADAHRKVTVPKFYDDVRPQTEDEARLYQVLSGITQQPPESLSSRWREPSLTVHNIEVSGPKNSTVIPGTVKAEVSVRIVPDQDLETIAASLCGHIKSSFSSLNSPNTLNVSIEHTADWWLGDLDDPWFKALEGAIRDEWGAEPLRIREGGSIPSVPFLEKELGCHALHLPLGQSTDQAHLPNERISLSNLRRGKSVIERFLLAAANSEHGMSSGTRA
ncbi:hypothetical protein PLICRDRAFT_174166 [Plicaturopsis crispa FD-325 SS-3]|nr:hypothetical protein PLICRDRAFT_174166 [Plicaturopsis crispa FD-325 SS-3]